MHKWKQYVSQFYMYGNENFSNWLLIPSRPDDFIFFSLSSFDIYLPSSKTERHGIANGSCLLVLCLQKSCKRFEHSYTVVRGSVNDSATDRKWLLKTFARNNAMTHRRWRKKENAECERRGRQMRWHTEDERRGRILWLTEDERRGRVIWLTEDERRGRVLWHT